MAATLSPGSWTDTFQSAVPDSVLLADSDRAFGGSVATLLAMVEGFTTTLAQSAEETQSLLATGQMYGTILIGVELPDQDGISLCATLRSQNVAMPIILLSASADEQLLVQGLRAGADDFLRKPFRGSELLARIRARMRSFRASSGAAIHLGHVIFDPSKRSLFFPERNSRLALADKEARLLWHLHDAGGERLTREALLHAIWGYSQTATTHTVETHIYRLRRKIELDPARPTVVLTERGGYRLGLAGQQVRPTLSFPPRMHNLSGAGVGRAVFG